MRLHLGISRYVNILVSTIVVAPLYNNISVSTLQQKLSKRSFYQLPNRENIFVRSKLLSLLMPGRLFSISTIEIAPTHLDGEAKLIVSYPSVIAVIACFLLAACLWFPANMFPFFALQFYLSTLLFRIRNKYQVGHYLRELQIETVSSD